MICKSGAVTDLLSGGHWEKRGFPEEEITILLTANEQVGKKLKQRRECDGE